MLRPLPGADQRCGFEAIHFRHFHIEEDSCKIVVEKEAQSLDAGVGLHQLMVGTFEDRLETEQIPRIVIHQENFRLVGRIGGKVGLRLWFLRPRNHASAPTPRKPSLASSWPRATQTRNTVRRGSRSAGFGMYAESPAPLTRP